MKAVIGDPTDDADWAAELKWDGLRTQVLTDGAEIAIRSSRGRDVTSQFPELNDFGRRLGTSAILDGELVVFDGDRPSFPRVLQRLNSRPTEQSLSANPAVYVVFDLLVLDGNPLLDLPYHARRQVLADLVSDDPRWRVPPSVDGGASQLLTLARQRDLEGIVIKRVDSPYRPGARTTNWRKVKIRLQQEFVVGGWLAGQGSLEDGIGSLVLGVWDGTELVVAGLAGSGLDDGARRQLAEMMVERPTPPFASVPRFPRRPTWVEPTLVAEIEFGDWPTEGMLRHPVYLGLRDDKDPSEVVREIAAPGQHTVPPAETATPEAPGDQTDRP
ncbi:MAG: non-homologous end-joining DNA ligase [Actinomycetota bacterium]